MNIKRKLLYRFKLYYDKDNIIDLNKNLNDINYEELFKIGQKGKTSSRLNPIGKAIFDDKVVEVKSYSDFVDSNQEIEIVNIEESLTYDIVIYIQYEFKSLFFDFSLTFYFFIHL